MKTNFNIGDIVYRMIPSLGGGIYRRVVVAIEISVDGTGKIVTKYKLKDDCSPGCTPFDTEEAEHLFATRLEALEAFKVKSYWYLDRKIKELSTKKIT